MRSFAFKKAKEEVEIENLRLCGTKTILVLEDGEWECLSVPHLFVASLKSKGKGKDRAAAACSCCGRGMSVKLASAEQPSDPGSTGPKWAAEERWVPLFNTLPEVPIWDSSRDSCNPCARSRQRLCPRQCQERDVVRCLESRNWLAGRRGRSVEHEGTKPGATQ